MNKNSDLFDRPKLLIVGSGFHRHVLGDCKSPLTCWKTLLQETAKRKGIEDSQIDFNQPTIAWELMVMALVDQDRTGELVAWRAENELKKTSIEVLSEEIDKHNGFYNNHKSVMLLQNFCGHVINLNFDQMLDHLLGIEKKKKAFPAQVKIPKPSVGYKKDGSNLYRRWTATRKDDGNLTVWHPHGSIQHKESLRLGFRDYGLQPALFAGAFEHFKAWESKALDNNKKGQPRTEKEYLKLLEKAKCMDHMDYGSTKNKIEKHDHWVTRFMLYDVFIIGAGISPSEIGLRWLLVQRHRNLARVEPKNRPKTVFLDVKENYPTGLMDYNISSSWDQAWHKALT